ncbi:hypothetical protein SGLAD_v1c09620 [Spiroplasma gladiatoris]|uniref:Uncharacterized protein n=1 Tax=Spiroplasma gladiatoris TaxID=2143 RepID=A0A4P7AJ02_9MOLU|nr:YwaF family protein [Spiroplasma gladiatoris]QBQ08161.1 hypothetical protein SGLAD_v1c09620 [Spiroplasma gladiatoris]
MENLSWVVAIVLALFMWASLSIFPNYYNKKMVYLTIRIVLIIFLLFTQIQRTIYLGPIHQNEYIKNPNSSAYEGQEWYQNPVNYFLLYFCTLSAWSILIILIYPSKKVMECFFPYMIMGPIVTFIFPTEKPLFWNLGFVNWFTFFFGHACTLFATMFMYLYGHTGYKFNKQAIIKSVITGALVLSCVEVWNFYFGTNFIIGEVQGAFDLKWARPWIMFFTMTVGSVYLAVGLSFAYFFKPIYEKNNIEKLHLTWWEKFLFYVKRNQDKKINK